MRLHLAHGTRNDFVVVPDPDGVLDLSPEAVVAMCDRRSGLGADGVLRLAPPREGVGIGGSHDDHVFMDYRNADGSVAETCGNGLRVVARHLVAHGWTDDRELRIGTRAGQVGATVHVDDAGEVDEVTVAMGPPAFAGPDLPPVDAAGLARVDHAGGAVAVRPVSMGNPHAVLLVEDPTTAPVTTLGPAIETSAAYPNGTNVEFVRVDDDRSVTLRVWERGVGETEACGTGVCGAVAVLVATGRVVAGEDVRVTVPGGVLRVRWSGAPDDDVMLTGPAVEVATVIPDPAWLRGALRTITAPAADPAHA